MNDADDSPECVRCFVSINLRDHTEHTGYCDSCAQELVSSLEFRSKFWPWFLYSVFVTAINIGLIYHLV